MCDFLARYAEDRSWTSKDANVPSTVAIRISKRRYALSTRNDPRLATFEWAIAQLNAELAFTFTSSVVLAITSNMEEDMRYIQLSPSQIVQVVDTMEELAHARFSQKACFVRLEHTLVIWCDRVKDFQAVGAQWEDTLVAWVWQSREQSRLGDLQAVPALSKSGSYTDLASMGAEDKEELDEKDRDAEKGQARKAVPRRPVYYNAAYVGLSIALGGSFAASLTRHSLPSCLQISSSAPCCLNDFYESSCSIRSLFAW